MNLPDLVIASRPASADHRAAAEASANRLTWSLCVAAFVGAACAPGRAAREAPPELGPAVAVGPAVRPEVRPEVGPEVGPATGSAAGPAANAGSDEGFDISDFLDQKYGFLPVAIPITEPALGYGLAGGLAFVSSPLGGAAAGFGRPDISFVGGFGTENGSSGFAVGDVRYWNDDRIQTLAGIVDASVNLDFHGIGASSPLAEDPLQYELETLGGVLQAKFRIGDSAFWAGLGYVYAATTVGFDAPPGTPNLPDFSRRTDLGGLSPSLTWDTRDNVFTPTRGTFVEASVGLFAPALGADAEFQRPQLVAMQFVPLEERLFLGLRADFVASFGEVPFYLRPFVYMRGVPAMRYQGEEIAQVEAELRWQAWDRVSLLGFAGVGAAWSDLEDFEEVQSVPAGGFGLRYELARKYGLHAGIDLAFSEDEAVIYLQFGSAWVRP
jgi:hypothetical protein